MTTIFDLSEYELLKLFNYCDAETLANLQLTCKYFRDIIVDSPVIMSNLTIYVDGEVALKSVKERLLETTVRYQNIKLKNITFQNPEDFSTISSYLKSVTFENCDISKKHFFGLCQQAQSIETLKFLNVNIQMDFEDAEYRTVQDLCKILPNLKYLELKGIVMTIFRHYSFDGLEVLRLNKCECIYMGSKNVLKTKSLDISVARENFDSEDFEKLLKQLGPHLKVLKIKSNDLIFMSPIIRVLKTMEILEEFHLYCYLFQRDTAETFYLPHLKIFKFSVLHSFNQFLQGMPNLVTIVLHTPVTNVFLKAINKNCPNLKTLKFAHSVPNIFQNITFNNLECLAIMRVQSDFSFDFLANHPRLQELQVFDYPLNDSEVKLILERSPQLKFLEISDGENLTSESLNQETVGNLEKMKVYKFNPKNKEAAATLYNLRYYYEEQVILEPYIEWLKMPKKPAASSACQQKNESPLLRSFIAKNAV